MSLPIKIGGATVLLTGTGAGGVWILVYFSMPGWAPLTKDGDYSTAYSGKYGEKYGQFLVGVSVNNTVETDNIHWWEWSYGKQYLIDKKEDASHKPKGDFSNSSINSYEDLRETCKKAYLVEESKIKTSDSISSGEYSKEDVWRYCTAFSSSPKTVEEANGTSYGSGKFGETNKAKLASTKEGDNDWFWIIKSVEYFESDTDPVTSSNTEFKDLYKSEVGYQERIKKLRDACEAAYKQEATTVSTYKSELFKWCSFKGSE